MTAQTKHQVKVVKKNKDMNQLSATSNVILNIVFILAVIITVAPIWVIIMASFTSEKVRSTSSVPSSRASSKAFFSLPL